MKINIYQHEHIKEYTRLVAAWFSVEIQITSLMEHSNPRINIYKKALHKTTTNNS